MTIFKNYTKAALENTQIRALTEAIITIRAVAADRVDDIGPEASVGRGEPAYADVGKTEDRSNLGAPLLVLRRRGDLLLLLLLLLIATSFAVLAVLLAPAARRPLDAAALVARCPAAAVAAGTRMRLSGAD